MASHIFRPRPTLPPLPLPRHSFEAVVSRSRLAALLARLAPRVPTLDEPRCWEDQLPLTHVAVELHSPADPDPLLEKLPPRQPLALPAVAACFVAAPLLCLLMRLFLAGELEGWVGAQVQ